MTLRQMLKHAALCATLLSLTGCPADDPDEPAFYRLQGDLDMIQGFELATRTVVTGDYDTVRATDLFVIIGMEVSLVSGHPELSFCDQGEGFVDVEDIPTDATGCEWRQARLGPNSAPVPPHAPLDGYIVRDRTGSDLYRLLVVNYELAEPANATVDFTLAPL